MGERAGNDNPALPYLELLAAPVGGAAFGIVVSGRVLLRRARFLCHPDGESMLVDCSRSSGYAYPLLVHQILQAPSVARRGILLCL